MENYKKKYEDALERARKINSGEGVSAPPDYTICETIFPELKESEDEKIRKEILSYLKSSGAITNQSWIAWLEKQGEQKPSDKVEPKFKTGDWITDGIDVDKIIGIDLEDEDYLFENNTKSDISLVESISHLWTIQDAKDGDVLATKDIVFIFKHMDKTGLSLCKSYCEVIGNSGLGLGFDFSINGVYPATKEQRDKLEKAITAAGYKWDKEDLKLEKI